MSVEERFDLIERALKGLVEAQRLHTENVRQLVQTVGAAFDSADRRMTRIEDKLAASIESADARMTRTEQNLDVLIRAITSEHSNGKGNH